MKKLFTAIFAAALGIGIGPCAQNPYTDVDVNRFDQIIKSDSVQLVDVRKLDEFTGRCYSRCNASDVLTPSFLSNALAKLDKKRPCAVYCRSGKRFCYGSDSSCQRRSLLPTF
ncbi:rhodanese-like domain-containing protein [Prevotella melaninogenica]